MDTFHLPQGKLFTRLLFVGGSPSAGANWQAVHKPKGVSTIDILLFGQGGSGGTGVVGANSTAAGGGGGASGGQTHVTIPAHLIPDIFYVSCGNRGGAGNGIASYVSIRPNTTANHVIAIANGGGAGGNASGATAGAAGSAGAVATAATMPLGFNFAFVLAGQAGIIGGTTGNSAALTLPVTGLLVTGGTGGAGLGAGGANGGSSGGFTVPAAPSPFPPQLGVTGTSSATTPPGNGSYGFNNVVQGLQYNYGGTGGASTHGTATGAGLVQARGGQGGLGCGGGGMGGALTGSTPAVAALGGAGFCIITFC